MDSKIYTRTGDDGTTGLVGGSRIMKSDLRLDAYGTVDELNSYLGLIVASCESTGVRELLTTIQHKLFVIGSKLASDESGRPITDRLVLNTDDIALLENAIDEFERDLPELQSFILPGGTLLSGYSHVARTVCRRAERRIVELASTTEIDAVIVQYINRLSDFLFVLSRKFAKDQGIGDILWEHK